ncbi:MAG TPA: phospholipase D-like domain-containing protein, partial [Candidatus Paceibacterota bacterium]
NAATSYEAGIVAKLTAAGIPIETQQHPDGIMHIKALVTERAYASGSYNWTSRATQSNDEVLEIGTDQGLRAAYEAILKKLLAANAPGAAQSATPGTPSGTYSYTDAPQHIGETAAIYGTVVNVHTTKSGAVFFDYCTSYRTCPFSAVIFAGDTAKFGSLTRYQGKALTVTGPITSYQSHAEIVIKSPDQITER